MVDEIKNPSGQKPVSLEPPKDIENLLKELPKINSPPVSSPQVPASGFQPPAPQSTKSFVRTMAEDLEAAKKGLKPESKPFEIKPPPPALKAPAPTTMAPGAPRPPLPPQVRLGAPEKSKIIEAPKITPPPPIIPPTPPTGAPRPPLKFPPALRKLPISPKFLLLILGGAVILIGAWYFLTREPEETAVFTPTPPIVTPTPIPTPKTLRELFVANEYIISSDKDGETFLTDLKFGIDAYAPKETGGIFRGIVLIDGNGSRYQISQIFEKLKIIPPNGLLENLDPNEWIIAVYGQNEMFDSKGLLTFNQTPKPKIVLAAKIIDPINARSALNQWEAAMAEDLKDLFSLDLKKASSQAFSNNIYGGVNIRYRNFPFADNTLDYAIVDLPEFGLSYLVITNSREAIYSAINLLQNQ